MTRRFDPRDYWEDRLADDWTLRGVGFRRLGTSFNEWQYRQRVERFDAVVQQAALPLHEARVLDVGSGTGFYVDVWSRLGAKHIVGLDLTTAAVDRLQTTFAEYTFVRADITEGIGELEPGSFDVISCMDVMFHVVDNDRCAAALRNIASLLRAGGTFIWSDFFVHGRESGNPHIVWRSLYRIEALLDSVGLEIETRAPLFYLMNEPRDAPRIALPIWKALIWLACRTERSGDLTGRLLHRMERVLTRRCDESPSTEIMVCRKRSD